MSALIFQKSLFQILGNATAALLNCQLLLHYSKQGHASLFFKKLRLSIQIVWKKTVA